MANIEMWDFNRNLVYVPDGELEEWKGKGYLTECPPDPLTPEQRARLRECLAGRAGKWREIRSIRRKMAYLHLSIPGFDVMAPDDKLDALNRARLEMDGEIKRLSEEANDLITESKLISRFLRR